MHLLPGRFLKLGRGTIRYFDQLRGSPSQEERCNIELISIQLYT